MWLARPMRTPAGQASRSTFHTRRRTRSAFRTCSIRSRSLAGINKRPTREHGCHLTIGTVDGKALLNRSGRIYWDSRVVCLGHDAGSQQRGSSERSQKSHDRVLQELQGENYPRLLSASEGHDGRRHRHIYYETALFQHINVTSSIQPNGSQGPITTALVRHAAIPHRGLVRSAGDESQPRQAESGGGCASAA
jgi:hypothetical protein